MTTKAYYANRRAEYAVRKSVRLNARSVTRFARDHEPHPIKPKVVEKPEFKPPVDSSLLPWEQIFALTVPTVAERWAVIRRRVAGV